MFYSIDEFSEELGVSPATLFRRKDLPQHDNLRCGKGKAKKLWSESTVKRYRREVLARLKKALQETGEIKRAANLCRIGVRQAAFLIDCEPGVKKLTQEKKVRASRMRQIANYNIFLKVSSKLGVK